VCGNVTSPVARSTTQQEEIIMNGLSVSAGPNPSADFFILNIKSSDRSPVTIKITDIVGRVISIQPNVASNSILNVGHTYLPGVYFVQAMQGKQTVLLKLVKQR
jgi:hypothetical protein